MTADLTFHGEPPTHLTYPGLQAQGLWHASTTRHCPGIAHPSRPVSPVGREGAMLLALAGPDLGRVAFLHQVHGTTVVRVEEPGGLAGEGDALLTTRPRMPLAVFTADCLAVVLFDPVGQQLGLAHVGWRGTVKSALPHVVDLLVAAGARPAALVAAIFPSIGPCCYEVDRPVIDPLSAAFPGRWESWVRPSGPGKWRLDLWAANQSQLETAGLRPDRILNARLCTACRPDLFFSYRREGSRGRLVTLAALPGRGASEA